MEMQQAKAMKLPASQRILCVKAIKLRIYRSLVFTPFEPPIT